MTTADPEPALGDARASQPIALPDRAVRLIAALLALSVAAVHVADQGGLTAFTSPAWLAWAYRLIEIGGLLTAATLLLSRSTGLGWVAGALLGLGPFVGYLASRTIGVPGDPGDVGNWDDWVGTVALIVEAALVTVSVSVLLNGRRHRAPITDARHRTLQLNGVAFDHTGV